jgi:SPP1 gp7 family putative phage head morphogenesis protein
MITVKPLPFKEAQQFWKDKIKLKPSQYYDLSDEARSRAFGVSGVAKTDELETMFNAIQRAVDGKATFADFKKDCKKIAEKRGWQKGGHRLENIFRTNLQTAYMAGRWKQVKESARLRPYGQYSAVGDLRTRPTHLAMNNLVWPLDHPVWNTWWPPNGFKCRCDVRTLSARQVKERGLNVRDDDITGTLIEPVNPENGQKMPAVPLWPDNGFGHNPGKSMWGGMADSASLAKNGQTEILAGQKRPADYKRPKLANVRPAKIDDLDETMLWPAGRDDQYYVDRFKEKYGQGKVVKDASGEPVIISLRSFMADKNPGKETYRFSKTGHAETAGMIEEIVKNPYEIWLTPQKDKTGRIRLTKRYVSLWKTKDKEKVGGFAVFETYRGFFQGVTSFLPVKNKVNPDLSYLERQRTGLLLFKK